MVDGFTQAASGHHKAAERTLRELRAAAERRYVPRCNVALVYQGFRDNRNALRWLERGYDERDVRMVFLGVDPAWDFSRGNVQFMEPLKRMNFTN